MGASPGRAERSQPDQPTQPVDLVAGERSPRTDLQPSGIEAGVAGAPKPDDAMPHGLTHPPHLPVAAFVEDELQA